MPSTDAMDADRIVRVGEERRLEAVQRLLASGRASRAQAEQFLTFAAESGIRIDAMWARLDEQGRVQSTVLAVPNPGRTTILFASPPTSSSEAVDQGVLIDHASRQMAGMGIDLAQVLIDPGEALRREAFLAGGFHELARLSYLERPLRGARPDPPRWPDEVTVECYADATRGEVVELLEASYEETLDCPGLLGLRRTEDVLVGHQGTGEFDPGLWTVMRASGRATGVLLLNPSAASRTIELVYLGLRKEARGQGLGRRLLQHGIRLVADRTERAITLAVDERNDPAQGLYQDEGFHRVLKRTALIRSLRTAGA